MIGMNGYRLLIILLVFLTGCKDKFDAKLRQSDLSLLVVEGIVINGSSPTTIRLSRSAKLSDTVKIKPELKAKISILGNDNSNFQLTEAGNGIYGVQQLALDVSKEYKLQIHTLDGKLYESDYVKVFTSPAIDSISYAKEMDGLIVYANTHGDASTSKYYQWEFEETWEIHSPYNARYKWIGGTTIVKMDPNESYFYCWRTEPSKTIITASSVALQSNVISEAPLTLIPFSSEKLSVRYSILAKQYAISKEAYEFLNIMKKNTESLGSIFDAQPSELKGNIHCVTNASELAIGFVNISSVQEKRKFITNAEAGGTFTSGCDYMVIRNLPDSIANAVPFLLPFDVYKDLPSGAIVSYAFSTPQCIDCRRRGGSLTKPVFW